MIGRCIRFSTKKVYYGNNLCIRMSSKVPEERNLIPDLTDNHTKNNIRKNITPKEMEYFNDSFYWEQLSKLKLLKESDNVTDSYEDEPINDNDNNNSDALKEISIGQEELNILADFIYIDDNGKVRINKSKLEINQANNNIELILKFMCIYLSNFVPDKNDYERSLINLILSTDTAKQVVRNMKESVNWKTARDFLHQESNQYNSTCVKESLQEDSNLLSSKTSSVLLDDFKNRIQFPIIYAGGIVAKNHYCVGLVYPEYNQHDEYFKVAYPNPDITHCNLFTLNEAVKRALLYKWKSVQISTNSKSALKIVYDLVTFERGKFKQTYPKYTARFNEFLDELYDNSFKLNINWALYNNKCPLAVKLHSKLTNYRL